MTNFPQMTSPPFEMYGEAALKVETNDETVMNIKKTNSPKNTIAMMNGVKPLFVLSKTKQIIYPAKMTRQRMKYNV